MSKPWTNKIVGHAEVDPESLLAHPDNFRVHGNLQQKALEGSIDKLGFIRSVLVSKLSGRVVDGHLRVILALRNQEPTIPVEYVDLTEDEEREALLLLDPISALANTDKEKMAELLELVSSNDDGLKDILDAIAKHEKVEYGEKQESDAEPQIDRATELLEKWKVQMGDLWRVGNHRLLCGDSTNLEDLSTLFEDARADLVLTDPPYAVGYGAKNRALQTIGRANRLTSDIEGDDLDTESAASQLWGPAFENAYNFSRNGTVIYVFSPQGGDQMMMMMMMMMKAKWNERLHQLIWRKNSPTFSMGRLDYQYQHEPILYSWRGTNHGYYGETGRSVIDCDRPSSSKLHPTMKPIELIQTFIGNSSVEGEIVFDPFCGSGTTLVASGNMNRKCFAIEISPAYCSVVLERMSQAFPGIEIKKIN